MELNENKLDLDELNEVSGGTDSKLCKRCISARAMAFDTFHCSTCFDVIVERQLMQNGNY